MRTWSTHSTHEKVVSREEAMATTVDAALALVTGRWVRRRMPGALLGTPPFTSHDLV